jgi:two-component system chemotaxis response regulator CheY
MIVIAKNTERALQNELKECWQNQPQTRCALLRLSYLETKDENWDQIFFETIKEVLNGEIRSVYICEDGDVFMLSRSLTQKRLQDFIAHLAPKLSPAPNPELADLFEIKIHWKHLDQICTKKLETLALLKAQKEHQKNKQNKEDIALVSRETTLKTIDSDLMSSLAMRRERRNSLKIMVVEDDVFSQKLINNALGKKYDLSMAEDGRGAVMKYVNKAPDVLFLDIELPDMNGHQVLEKIFEFDPDAYVIMFSGNGSKDNIIRAIELGARGFIGKPFTQDKLLQYIEKSPFTQAKRKREGHNNGHAIN